MATKRKQPETKQSEREVDKRARKQREALEEKQRAQRGILHALLGHDSTTLSEPLPTPVVNIIADYSQILKWQLASFPPGYFGNIERVSDACAQHNGHFYGESFIQGDTPLAYGAHAWRVTVAGLGEEGSEAGLGIAEAGKELGLNSLQDPSFRGVTTWNEGWRVVAGKTLQDSSLGPIRNGDRVDFVLNFDARTLTVLTPKDGRKEVFIMPRNKEWVPHFWMRRPGNTISVEVLDPEQPELGGY